MEALAELAPISADSHLIEPPSIWQELPSRLRERMPKFKLRGDGAPEGGSVARARIHDQKLDGIGAEILYPNNAMEMYTWDPELQRAGFRVYNDWAADFCREDATRLFAVPAISAYDIDAAITELYRTHDMGMVAALIWQVPDPSLPLNSNHYERLWSAAEELGAPINFHILTGFGYVTQKRHGVERIRGAVNLKTAEAANALFDMIFFGVFDRHPRLKLVVVESEMSWIPYLVQQWDYYFERYSADGEKYPIKRRPSEIFANHVYATIIEDWIGARMLSWWGERNTMWSCDYPHPNTTFPNSKQVIAERFSNLSSDQARRVLRENAREVYRLPI